MSVCVCGGGGIITRASRQRWRENCKRKRVFVFWGITLAVVLTLLLPSGHHMTSLVKGFYIYIQDVIWRPAWIPTLYVDWHETQLSKLAGFFFLWSAEPFLENHLGRKLPQTKLLAVKGLIWWWGEMISQKIGSFLSAGLWMIKKALFWEKIKIKK